MEICIFPEKLDSFIDISVPHPEIFDTVALMRASAKVAQCSGSPCDIFRCRRRRVCEVQLQSLQSYPEHISFFV